MEHFKCTILLIMWLKLFLFWKAKNLSYILANIQLFINAKKYLSQDINRSHLLQIMGFSYYTKIMTKILFYKNIWKDRLLEASIYVNQLLIVWFLSFSTEIIKSKSMMHFKKRLYKTLRKFLVGEKFSLSKKWLGQTSISF